MKLFRHLLVMCVAAFLTIIIFYLAIWQNRGGNAVVFICRHLFGMNYDEAHAFYNEVFRENQELIWVGAVMVVLLILLLLMFKYFTRYFVAINDGIGKLLSEDSTQIVLPQELVATQDKLNEVKYILRKKEADLKAAECRKNDMIMYLAHDIRTPLTSIIGYLNFLSDMEEINTEQGKKYIDITLDKAYRLEKMINEFFEITKYSLSSISIEKTSVDLHYMLIQLQDEMFSITDKNGNKVELTVEGELVIMADADKLARAFANILKNAATYSYPNTTIYIHARKNTGISLSSSDKEYVVIQFQNSGKTIPKDKLSAIFEKMYRLDEARSSYSGGSGLGLAIAKEIIGLHRGEITVGSDNEVTTFTVTLPVV